MLGTRLHVCLVFAHIHQDMRKTWLQHNCTLATQNNQIDALESHLCPSNLISCLAWFMIFYSSEAWKWKGCDPLLPSTFFFYFPSSNIIPDSLYIVLFPTFPSLLVSLIGILPSLLIVGFCGPTFWTDVSFWC